MSPRWWLVPLDLALGGRLGALFAARDGFFAMREDAKARRDRAIIAQFGQRFTAAQLEQRRRRLEDGDPREGR